MTDILAANELEFRLLAALAVFGVMAAWEGVAPFRRAELDRKNPLAR